MERYKDLMEIHNRRISRAGKDLWEFVKSMHLEQISVEMALRLKNQYGFRPDDLIFICEMKGVSFDVVEFTRILNEEMESLISYQQCDEGRTRSTPTD